MSEEVAASETALTRATIPVAVSVDDDTNDTDAIPVTTESAVSVDAAMSCTEPSRVIRPAVVRVEFATNETSAGT